MATTLLSCRGDDDDHIDDHDHDLNVDESWHDNGEDTYIVPHPIRILLRPRLSMWLAHIVVSLVLSVTIG